MIRGYRFSGDASLPLHKTVVTERAEMAFFEPLTALREAGGTVLYGVSLSGITERWPSAAFGLKRRYTWRLDATEVLRRFAARMLDEGLWVAQDAGVPIPPAVSRAAALLSQPPVKSSEAQELDRQVRHDCAKLPLAAEFRSTSRALRVLTSAALRSVTQDDCVHKCAIATHQYLVDLYWNISTARWPERRDELWQSHNAVLTRFIRQARAEPRVRAIRVLLSRSERRKVDDMRQDTGERLSDFVRRRILAPEKEE